MLYYAFRTSPLWVEVRRCAPGAPPPKLTVLSSPQEFPTTTTERVLQKYDSYGDPVYKLVPRKSVIKKTLTTHHYDGGEFVCTVPWTLFYTYAKAAGYELMFRQEKHYLTYENYCEGSRSKILELPAVIAEAIAAVEKKAPSRRTVAEASIVWKE